MHERTNRPIISPFFPFTSTHTYTQIAKTHTHTHTHRDVVNSTSQVQILDEFVCIWIHANAPNASLLPTSSGKSIKANYIFCVFQRICDVLVHDSSVISSSQKCGWFDTSLCHYKQIIFNWNVQRKLRSSGESNTYTKHANASPHTYTYIYIKWSANDYESNTLFFFSEPYSDLFAVRFI